MSATKTRTPVELLASIIRCLSEAVVTQGIIYRLTPAIVGLLTNRFRTLKESFNRLAARIEAGTFRPRRSGPRRQPAARKPRQPAPLRQNFGWLVPLLRREDAMCYRGYLQQLLQTPETVALIEAAPAEMARILRPLCWALWLKPPKILARPRRAPSPPEAPAAPAAPASPVAIPPGRTRPPPAPATRPRPRRPRACGPPLPA